MMMIPRLQQILFCRERHSHQLNSQGIRSTTCSRKPTPICLPINIVHTTVLV